MQSQREITNIQLASDSVSLLSELGVEEMVLCSGNRNAPFIAVVSKQSSVRVFHHFNESAAGFFALGRIKAHGKPVAVVVTSGTAAVELAPATCEAFYSRLPLLLVTADRPKRYRGSGAPQSIDQRNLYGSNVGACFDVDANTALPIAEEVSKLLGKFGPVQLNVCFEEPLIDEDLVSWSPQPPLEDRVGQTTPVLNQSLNEFLLQISQPLVILGRIPKEARPRVESFVKSLRCPIYAECLSGMREFSSLQDQILHSGDALLRKFEFDSIIRIGSVPTLGFWRDLERNPKFQTLPVVSLTDEDFSGLARDSFVFSLSNTSLDIPHLTFEKSYEAQALLDRRIREQVESIFAELPSSEPSLYFSASQFLESDAFVYLGNSLPIRLWDLAASYSPSERIFEANRGVNGIDGQLSTFLGACRRDRMNWCFVGDLTTLYDLSSPFILPQLDPDVCFRLVVVNNGGGRIFELLPDYSKHFRSTPAGDAFIQPQEVNLDGFAKLWNVEFRKVSSFSELEDLPSRCIVELIPNQQHTREFWSQYKACLARDSF